MEKKKLIEICNKYNVGKQDRTVLLGMVAEYRKVKLSSSKSKNKGKFKQEAESKIKQAVLWVILKKIWDYLEGICT